MQGLAVTTNQAKHIFGLVWWWKVSRRKRLANGHRLRPEFRFTHEHWLVAVFQADRTFHGRSLLFFAKSPEGNSSADEQYLYFRWGISNSKIAISSIALQMALFQSWYRDRIWYPMLSTHPHHDTVSSIIMISVPDFLCNIKYYILWNSILHTKVSAWIASSSLHNRVKFKSLLWFNGF